MSDGGPAFPANVNLGATFDGKDTSWHDGMTLRDYFAAKAMPSIMVGAVLPTKEMRDEWLPKVAEVAYEVADAMLKERSKK